MTVTPVAEELDFHVDKTKYRLISDSKPIPLPGKPYMAIRLTDAMPKVE